MKELYWITRLDSLSTMFQAFMVSSIIISIMMTILWLICKADHAIDREETYAKLWEKVLKLSFPTMIISILGFIFTPTTKEAYLIYGVGTSIDYLRNDSTAVGLPHKAIEALDMWVEKVMPEEKRNKNRED